MGRRTTGQKKADSLLGRFPVTDLAKAVARSGENRVTFLRQFVDGVPKGSYAPLRLVTPRIYGVQPPLMSLPVEGWSSIENALRSVASPANLERNVTRGRQLFDHVQSEGYEATFTDRQVFRYGRGSAPIGLDFYLTKGERLFFQFPHFRSSALTPREALVLCSIASHAYAIGDFDAAEVEIVQFVRSRRNSFPHVICPERAALLDRVALSAEIDEVYLILRQLAEGTL